MKLYYDQNKEAILKDLAALGTGKMLKKWGMSSSTLTGLCRCWNIPRKARAYHRKATSEVQRPAVPLTLTVKPEAGKAELTKPEEKLTDLLPDTAKRLAAEHWEWLKGVFDLIPGGVSNKDLIGRLYQDAFIHGWKHRGELK